MTTNSGGLRNTALEAVTNRQPLRRRRLNALLGLRERQREQGRRQRGEDHHRPKVGPWASVSNAPTRIGMPTEIAKPPPKAHAMRMVESTVRSW